MCWPSLGAGRRGAQTRRAEIDRRGHGLAHRAVEQRRVHEAAGGVRLPVVDQFVGGLHGCPPHASRSKIFAPLVAVPGGEHRVQDLDERSWVGGAGEDLGEPRIVGQLGPVDGPQHGRPYCSVAHPAALGSGG